MTCEFDPTHEVREQGCFSTRFFETVQVPRQDEDGYPVYSQLTGELQYVTVPLARPIVTHSRLDPTGLAEAACGHGLTEPVDEEMRRTGSVHPDGRRLRIGLSWVRSKYLDTKGECPVCRGEERPADMTLRRDLA